MWILMNKMVTKFCCIIDITCHSWDELCCDCYCWMQNRHLKTSWLLIVTYVIKSLNINVRRCLNLILSLHCHFVWVFFHVEPISWYPDFHCPRGTLNVLYINVFGLSFSFFLIFVICNRKCNCKARHWSFNTVISGDGQCYSL